MIVQIGAHGLRGHHGDPGAFQDVFPAIAELGVPVVDHVPAADILQPAALHGFIPCDLSHVGLIGVLGDAENLHLARAEVDGEQNIVGLLPKPSPNIDGKEVGGDQHISFVGDELLPVMIPGPLGSVPLAISLQDGTNGSRREGDQTQDQHSGDPNLTPGRILLRHPQNHLLDGSRGARVTGTPLALNAELPGSPQAIPALDGLRLGHRSDLGQSLPSNRGAGHREADAPSICEANNRAGWQVLSRDGELVAEVGQLSEQALVLTGRDGRSNQPDEEGGRVHGGTQDSTTQGVSNRLMLMPSQWIVDDRMVA